MSAPIRMTAPPRRESCAGSRPLEPLPDEPSELEPEEPSDLSDLEFEEMPCTDDDDARWEVFIPDDDERDPVPEPGDFWTGSSRESRVEGQVPEPIA